MADGQCGETLNMGVPMNYSKAYTRLNASLANLGTAETGATAGLLGRQNAPQADGVLSAKVKGLMALAIGVAVNREGGILHQVHDSLSAGASAEEIAETVGVAVMIGGGPALVCGGEALEALAEFTAAP